MAESDVAVVGAGPFGLSISAHLSAMGCDHRILGRPMDTWRTHMPSGMMLRSEPYGSGIAAPASGYDVGSYCQDRGLPYVDRLGPLSLETFQAYSDWFTADLVPNTEDLTVRDIVATSDGYRLHTNETESFTARRVVIATGVLPYRRMPEELAGLGPDLASHSSDRSQLGRFAGRRVAVVGIGQSATETAALLHESGADVVMIGRKSKLNWLEPNPEHLSGLGRIRRPVNNLCEGWHCAFWNSPAAFRTLPANVRIDKARTVLGPAGAWWLKDRVEGKVEVLTSHRVVTSSAVGSGVRLELAGPDGTVTLDVDHVIAGTGFALDIARLPFLGANLLDGIDRLAGSPVLNRNGESTAPGLFFAGATAAVSLGPSVRFIAGTHTSARRTAKALAARQPSTTASRRLTTRPITTNPAEDVSAPPRTALSADR